jgi:PST family polysaccharide transporter
LRNKIGIYKAFLHSAVAKYCAYAINLLSLIVLSRIFDQDDFGKIASIQVFVILFLYVAEGTIVPAIINLEFIKKRERDSINFTVMILAIAGFIVLVSLKSSLDALYVVTFDWSLYLLLALSVIPSVCLLYPQALIFREKKFYFISIAAVVAEVVSILIVVILENLIDLSRLLALKILSTSILLLFIFFVRRRRWVGLCFMCN